MSAIALLTDHHCYFLYSRFINIQKSFDCLCGIVRNELGKTVNDKDIFIFFNKRCIHVKLLLQSKMVTQQRPQNTKGAHTGS
ncbi:IS66 family insertion sequence element accessory protein TnpB [Niastella koreensis]|uniref:IS66 family insertion sequence element accessory protein TnpB n=1 Tax=Niastella koreensis TaxID=354356 RepID=UPI0009006111